MIVLFMGDFISSILIWTPVRRNALIHCILSNCLFGGGRGEERERTFLDSGRLPGCSPYYSASMQWLSPCTPTLPCKNIFFFFSRENIMSFHPGLLRASAPPVCFPLPRRKKGWNISALMIFWLAIITLSLLYPCVKAAGECFRFRFSMTER